MTRMSRAATVEHLRCLAFVTQEHFIMSAPNGVGGLSSALNRTAPNRVFRNWIPRSQRATVLPGH